MRLTNSVVIIYSSIYLFCLSEAGKKHYNIYNNKHNFFPEIIFEFNVDFRHVYVLPVFEVADDEPDIPRTKPELLDLYEKDKAVYFHRYVCNHCQRFPGIQRWLQRKVHPKTKSGTIQVLIFFVFQKLKTAKQF